MRTTLTYIFSDILLILSGMYIYTYIVRHTVLRFFVKQAILYYKKYNNPLVVNNFHWNKEMISFLFNKNKDYSYLFLNNSHVIPNNLYAFLKKYSFEVALFLI